MKVGVSHPAEVTIIDSGVNPTDRPQIIDSLLHFLDMDPSSVKSLVW